MHGKCSLHHEVGEYLENIDKNTSPELAQQYLDDLSKATMD